MEKFIYTMIIVAFVTLGVIVGVASKEYFKWITSSILVSGVLVGSLVINDKINKN